MRYRMAFLLLVLATLAGLPALRAAGPAAESTSAPDREHYGRRSYGSADVDPAVSEALASAPSVAVIVSLAVKAPPAGGRPPVDVAAQARDVAAAGRRVVDSVAPPQFKLTRRYAVVPALSGGATAAGVRALAAHRDVIHVGLDRTVHASLAEAVPLINADDVHGVLGVTGAGVTVAVLDTGIDTDHPLLSDDLTHQECFLSGATCPPPPNVAEDGAGHGTHVSGIITSAGPPVGVAPDALIEAFKVLSDTGSGSFSDIVAAYDHIITGHPEVDVINMSLGDGGSWAPGSCEAFVPAFTSAVATARAMGITSFAAAGNSGSKSGISFPACLNDIVSVGAVYDADVGPKTWSACSDAATAADQVTCFSQSHPSLDLLAPGAIIQSTVLGGGLGTSSGTSMATPAAAAVAALLLASEPGLTPAGVETRLKETGVPILDAGSGVTTCRVDAYEAVLNDGGPVCVSSGPPPPANDDFAAAAVIPGPLPYTNSQSSVAATTEAGEPLPCGFIGSTVWYVYTPASDDTIVVDSIGSGYDTVVAVYTGSDLASLSSIACNDDAVGLQSRVQFEATGLTAYYIQAGGYNGAAGSLTLNVASVACPPAGNYGFEAGPPDTNAIPCWTVNDQSLAQGSWCAQTGTSLPAGPCLGSTVSVAAPPELLQSAMTNQAGPGSHVLYQCGVLGAGAISFALYLNNEAGAFSVQPSLDYAVAPNQQFRADLVTAAGMAADPFTVAPGDILSNLYQTLPGDPAVSGYNTIVRDGGFYVGQEVCLRFAEVDSELFFHAGIDDVQIDLDGAPCVPSGANFDGDGPPYGAGAGIGNGKDLAAHDATVPNSDTVADNCDVDDDNDGIPDALDAAPRGDVTYDDDDDGTMLGPDDDGPSWDSDGNGIRDGLEGSCPLALNPNTDDDGDGLLNTWEVCKWGTNPALQDSDGDGLNDCREAADVNGDGVADFIGDAIAYARAALLPAAAFGKDGDFDINGDGAVDFVGDVIQEAKFALLAGLCQ